MSCRPTCSFPNSCSSSGGKFSYAARHLVMAATLSDLSISTISALASPRIQSSRSCRFSRSSVSSLPKSRASSRICEMNIASVPRAAVCSATVNTCQLTAAVGINHMRTLQL